MVDICIPVASCVVPSYGFSCSAAVGWFLNKGGTHSRSHTVPHLLPPRSRDRQKSQNLESDQIDKPEFNICHTSRESRFSQKKVYLLLTIHMIHFEVISGNLSILKNQATWWTFVFLWPQVLFHHMVYHVLPQWDGL